jgi:hypothetical protein
MKIIPANLDEALRELESQLKDDEKAEILGFEEEDFVIMSHMFLGQELRNQWLYPGDSPLLEFFKAEGLFLEDDMSDILLRSFYRYLKGEDIRYEEQLRGKPRYKKAY